MNEISGAAPRIETTARPLDMIQFVRAWLEVGMIPLVERCEQDPRRIRLAEKRGLVSRVREEPLKRWTVYEFVGSLVEHGLVRSRRMKPGLWDRPLYVRAVFRAHGPVDRYYGALKPGGVVDRLYRWVQGLIPWRDNVTPC